MLTVQFYSAAADTKLSILLPLCISSNSLLHLTVFSSKWTNLINLTNENRKESQVFKHSFIGVELTAISK